MSGCAEKPVEIRIEAPAGLYVPEPEYLGELMLMGQLAEAYVQNTLALRRANNKLNTLCKIHEVCAEVSLNNGATK